MKIRRKEPGFYEKEVMRLQERIEYLEPMTPEYDKCMEELLKLQTFAGKEKERKQIFDKAAKGAIAGKTIGFLGLGSLVLMICGFEKSGHMFTGSNGDRGFIGSIIKMGARLFG